jgi:hypothetical protein
MKAASGVICPFCSSPIVRGQHEIIDETLIGANHYLHRPFNNSSKVVGNNSETPCGMKCIDCYRYKNAWCLGCPASKDYKNPMLKLSNF